MVVVQKITDYRQNRPFLLVVVQKITDYQHCGYDEKALKTVKRICTDLGTNCSFCRLLALGGFDDDVVFLFLLRKISIENEKDSY